MGSAQPPAVANDAAAAPTLPSPLPPAPPSDDDSKPQPPSPQLPHQHKQTPTPPPAVAPLATATPAAAAAAAATPPPRSTPQPMAPSTPPVLSAALANPPPQPAQPPPPLSSPSPASSPRKKKGSFSSAHSAAMSTSSIGSAATATNQIDIEEDVDDGSEDSDGNDRNTSPALLEAAADLQLQYWIAMVLVNSLLCSFFAVHIYAAVVHRPGLFVLHPVGIALFCVLSANASLLTRLFRHDPTGRLYRSLILPLTLLSFFCLFAAAGVAIYLHAIRQRPHFSSAHTQIGLVILILSLPTTVTAVVLLTPTLRSPSARSYGSPPSTTSSYPSISPPSPGGASQSPARRLSPRALHATETASATLGFLLGLLGYVSVGATLGGWYGGVFERGVGVWVSALVVVAAAVQYGFVLCAGWCCCCCRCCCPTGWRRRRRRPHGLVAAAAANSKGKKKKAGGGGARAAEEEDEDSAEAAVADNEERQRRYRRHVRVRPVSPGSRVPL
ncbi:hypothetical protein DFJ73DRAFT_172250 [Zopfochytrium polystomum]|nr:hypothetical protein DFJ73DRAFT_172250 [Zopfochytrium polystomum]